MSEFEEIERELRFRGAMIAAGVARYRYADGEEVAREAVWHPGAVGIIALDADAVWLCRQPREVPGLAVSLEIPAGKLDREGESPLDTAQRELAEEVGMRARRWRELLDFYTSPGFSDERVWLYLAQELEPLAGGAAPDHGERVSAERWPLARLQDAIAACRDSKSLIALLWLTARGSDPGRQE
jgi:8-oxo-dGTP pyrophosphatase MutT (NUDIX family)